MKFTDLTNAQIRYLLTPQPSEIKLTKNVLSKMKRDELQKEVKKHFIVVGDKFKMKDRDTYYSLINPKK